VVLLLLLLPVLMAPRVEAGDDAPRRSRSGNPAAPHLVMLIAEPEYKTRETLPAFAEGELSREFCWSIYFGKEDDPHALAEFTSLDDADVLLISIRRRVLPEAQLQLIRKYIAAGRPVVGIRTASHAFSLRGDKEAPAGYALWEGFDPEVLGGHYTGHHSNDTRTAIRVAPGAAKHPILAGVDLREFSGNGSLYRVSPLAKSTTPLLIGSIPGHPDEPVAWTNTSAGGGRVFYTSLGHPKDFESPAFRRLLKNGILWAVGTNAPRGKCEGAFDTVPK